MKKVVVLVVIVVAGAILYFKFRDRIPADLSKIKEQLPGSSPPASPPTLAPTRPEEKRLAALPLMNAEFVAGLPDGSPAAGTADPTRTDLALELGSGERSLSPGAAGRVRLSDSLWLDTASLAGHIQGSSSEHAFLLAHVRSVTAGAGGAEQVAQAAAEPIPSGLRESLQKQTWRALPGFGLVSNPDPARRRWWITEFMSRLRELGGSGGAQVDIEGTFHTYERIRDKAYRGFVTFEETKSVKFFVTNGTDEQPILAAEKLRKEGFPVTLRTIVIVGKSQHFALGPVEWNMPVRAQYDYWHGVWSDQHAADARYWLALSAWANVRGLDPEAAAAFAQAGSSLSRSDAAEHLGRPSKMVRVHLADQVQDHWFYDSLMPVWGYANASWHGTGLVEEFYAAPPPAYALVRTGPAGNLPGSLYPVSE